MMIAITAVLVVPSGNQRERKSPIADQLSTFPQGGVRNYSLKLLLPLPLVGDDESVTVSADRI